MWVQQRQGECRRGARSWPLGRPRLAQFSTISGRLGTLAKRKCSTCPEPDFFKVRQESKVAQSAVCRLRRVAQSRLCPRQRSQPEWAETSKRARRGLARLAAAGAVERGRARSARDALSRLSIFAAYQFRFCHAQRYGQTLENTQGDVTLPVLDAGQIRRMDSGIVRNFILRSATRVPQSLNVRTDNYSEIHPRMAHYPSAMRNRL